MNSKVVLSAQTFGLTQTLYEKALEGLSRDELCKPAGPASNPMIWIAAHLAHARCGLLTILGDKRDIPWGGAFGRGQHPGASAYPEIGEVLSLWRQTGPALQQRLETLGEEELSCPSPRDFPIPDKTVTGAIHFLSFHESYHIGQMAYLRKWLGKESLVG